MGLAVGGAGAAVLLGLVIVGAERTDRSVAFFTRDALVELDAPIYTGALSTIGVLIWWSGGVAALLAALTLWRTRPESARALLAGGLLTVMLAFDDLFVVHEELAPDLLGVPEELVYAAYAAAGAAFVLVYRRFLATPPRALLLALAVALFGASIAFDLVAPGRPVLEDGAKLFGIVVWTVLFVGASVDELRRTALSEPARAPR